MPVLPEPTDSLGKWPARCWREYKTWCLGAASDCRIASGSKSDIIRSVSKLRFSSAEAPFEAVSVAGEAARLLCQAEASGLWDPQSIVTRLDSGVFAEALGAIAASGVAPARAIEWTAYADKGAEEFAGWIHGIRSDLAACPVPERELGRLEDTLGAGDTHELLGVSASAYKRYRVGLREVPDVVALRAHVVAGIVGDLAGSYNERGIRRWFKRPRPQLDGKAPSDVLSGDWNPDGEQTRRVAELARHLTG